jgi:hypothetical protein
MPSPNSQRSSARASPSFLARPFLIKLSLTFFSPRTHSANLFLSPCSSFGELQAACTTAPELAGAIADHERLPHQKQKNRPERTEQDGHQPPRQALCHFGRRHHHPRARSRAPGRQGARHGESAAGARGEYSQSTPTLPCCYVGLFKSSRLND